MFGIEDAEARTRRLVELNTLEQVINVHKTSIIQKAHSKSLGNGEGNSRLPRIHGVVFDPATGRLQRLSEDIDAAVEKMNPVYRLS